VCDICSLLDGLSDARLGGSVVGVMFYLVFDYSRCVFVIEVRVVVKVML